MVGIALWGLGPHAFKNVLPAIAVSPDVELVGVCSRTAAKRDEATRHWGGMSWADPDEMLRCERVQLVYVATPNGLHVAHGMQVLTAGKHLICEKSLAAELKGAERLLQCARDKALVLCEAMMFRYHPRFLAIRAIVHGDAFGRPAHAFCYFTLPPLDHPGFRDDPSLGGGALLDVGCYPLAMVRGLFGDVSTVVTSDVNRTGSNRVDRSGSASLCFAGGVRADVAWAYDQAYAAELVVLGERQTLSACRVFAKETGADNTILVRDRFGIATKILIPEANGFENLLATAIRAMESSRERELLREDAEAQARLIADVANRARS